MMCNGTGPSEPSGPTYQEAITSLISRKDDVSAKTTGAVELIYIPAGQNFLSGENAWQHNRCPPPASLSGCVAIATAAMGNTVFLPSASGSRTKRHVQNRIEWLVLHTTLQVTYITLPNRNPRRLRDSHA